ncbi:hypothetical protein GQ44DRAFT_697766 [Phaeosphaeriaceae sp. PMI808]|nr:hypothetical protein GQ44DRAFT_697766 [Phaeosphaeriaceae sp. PMI808]
MKLGNNLVSFLENVAKMFERLAFTLPQFQSWFDLCKKNVRTCDKDRLGHALSFIYSDIIQFCLHVYRLFSRCTKSSGLLNRAKSATGLVWKPFQSHFSHVIERLDKHQAWFETEAMIHQHATITEHFNSFQDYLKSTEMQSEREAFTTQAKEKKEYTQHVRDIKEWITSPLYRDIYERTKRDRMPGSGQDFLLDKRYLKWRNRGFQISTPDTTHDSLDAHLEGIFFAQAKPGYGKTYLSGIVIDDLLEHAQNCNPSQVQVPSVVFYHFTSSNRWGSDNVEEALRSITSQLLVVHKNDRFTIDALILLMNETGSGQRQASTEDIRASLALLLRRHPTYIVIDAIDECQEPGMFKRHILEISKLHDCQIFLLGRPTTPFPRQSCHRLTGVLNEKDINKFLSTNFMEMSDEGLLGPTPLETASLAGHATNVTEQSSGMFLWARLFLNYLCSPALTPRQRLHSLQYPYQFRGIDILYDSILSLIRRSGEENAKVAGNVIAWLSAAMFPLSNEVLHTALAVIPGRQTDPLDYLTDYPDCISRITCALVETTETGDMGFIHLSFKEYLETKMDSAHPLPIGSIDSWSTIHLMLAIACLSYLANDVPARPLQILQTTPENCSGPSIEASAATLQASNPEGTIFTRAYVHDCLRKQYPLLRYATLAWSTHLERAHGHDNYRFRASGDQQATGFSQSWVSMLARFLVDRQTVTMWAEACCIYEFRPKLQSVAKAIGYLSYYGSSNTMTGREMKWVWIGMQQLTGALDHLSERYPEVILYPWLMWTKNVTDAHDKAYWPNWDEKLQETKGDGRGPESSGEASFKPDPGRVMSHSRFDNLSHLYIQ